MKKLVLKTTERDVDTPDLISAVHIQVELDGAILSQSFSTDQIARMNEDENNFNSIVAEICNEYRAPQTIVEEATPEELNSVQIIEQNGQVVVKDRIIKRLN